MRELGCGKGLGREDGEYLGSGDISRPDSLCPRWWWVWITTCPARARVSSVAVSPSRTLPNRPVPQS